MRSSAICNESWLSVSRMADAPVTSPNRPKSLGDSRRTNMRVLTIPTSRKDSRRSTMKDAPVMTPRLMTDRST